jgi:hypothetical protein
MNRVTIRNRVIDYLDRSDLNTKIENWINDVRLDLALKYNFRYLFTEATANTVAGSARYALPSDYLGHLVLWLGPKKLMRVSQREFDELTQTDSTADASPRELSLESGHTVNTTSIVAVPDYYIERGMEIDLYPTPDASYVLTLRYYAQPESYDTGTGGDSEEDYLMRFHPEAIIWGAALRGAIYLDDEQKKANFAAAYKSTIEEMIYREKQNLNEDTHPRMKNWLDFDLSTFKRMVRVNIPGGTVSKWDRYNP